MKLLRTIIAALILSGVAFAWNCPSGQIRQQAPAGTPSTTPYYDVVEGIAFICVPTPTPNPSTGSNTNTNSNTNSNSNENKNTNNTSVTNTLAQKQKQQQKQQQTQTATGGNATSTSNAQGGNAASTSSATENGNNSNNTTTNIAAPKIPVSTAIAPPIMPTVPCFKGYGGGVQTMAFGGSFGGGKVDPGCDDRELARSFSGPQTPASCKILINTKKAKKAGVTMEECLNKQEAVAEVPPAPPFPVVIYVEAPALPAVTPALPVLKTEVTVVAPKKKKKVIHHMPPNCQNEVIRVCR